MFERILKATPFPFRDYGITHNTVMKKYFVQLCKSQKVTINQSRQLSTSHHVGYLRTSLTMK